jgi:putative glutamine amidotransferase
VQVNLLPRRYAEAVARAGGLPVLLPPVPGIGDALDRLDGLILSGGGDVDPARYGAARDSQTDPANTARDEAEFALCAGALARGLPLLAICRGLQVLNVVLGGTLHQHLPDVVGTDAHSPEVRGYGRHEVSVAPGSRLASVLGCTVLGRTELAVPTHHHQAADKLGTGLIATAWTGDGIIEAVELEPSGGNEGSPFLLAVQWHPEADDDLSLFNGLIAAASRPRVPANA